MLLVSSFEKGNIKNIGLLIVEIAIIGVVVGRSIEQILLFIIGGITGKVVVSILKK